jgi:hypothetical protein
MAEQTVTVTWSVAVTYTKVPVKLSRLCELLIEHAPDALGEKVGELLDNAPWDVERMAPVLAAIAREAGAEPDSLADDLNDVSHDVDEDAELTEPSAS